jgi:hypothetical protein
MAALAHFLTAVLAALALHTTPTTAGNRVHAERDAAHLLRLVVLPSSAQRFARPPGHVGGLLGKPLQIPSGKLVDRHRLWHVHASLGSVVGYLEAHPPRGSQLEGHGDGSDGPNVPRYATLTFAFREQAGRISLRWLNVTLVPLRDGGTGVRADAQDVWVTTRPRGEFVPAGAKEIDVGTHRVTDPANVAKVVRWFDALPIVQPGIAYHCPALVAGPKIRLDFRGANGLLARATYGADTMNHSLVSEPCTPISFSTQGQVKFPPLVGGDFLLRVQRLLGLRLL